MDWAIQLPDAATLMLVTVIFAAFTLSLFSRKFGIFGMIGIVGTIFFFYAQISSGTSDRYAALFLMVGIVLILFEHFVPGGIAATLGTISTFVSFVLVIGNLNEALLVIGCALAFSIAVFLLMTKAFKKEVSLFKMLVLNDSISTDKGFTSSLNRGDLLNQEGTTITKLRPVGRVQVNGEKLDAISDGDFIESGVSIRVVDVSSGRIIVRREDETCCSTK